MSIIKEIYLSARNQEVELSLKETLEIRKQAEIEINQKVNEIGKLELIDLISLMVPIVVAPLKEKEYFGQLFNGLAGNLHAQTFASLGYNALADTQRLIQAIFGPTTKQKFLFSLKEDVNSPAKFSVKRFMLLIDSEALKLENVEEHDVLLKTLGIPEGHSANILFDDELNYDSSYRLFDQIVLSNLINTYILTTIAVKEPKLYTGSFNYKVTLNRGRSTYVPDKGEVLFELTQASEVPSTWFEIFDKVDLEDFDLKSELAKCISTNLDILNKVV